MFHDTAEVHCSMPSCVGPSLLSGRV